MELKQVSIHDAIRGNIINIDVTGELLQQAAKLGDPLGRIIRLHLEGSLMRTTKQHDWGNLNAWVTTDKTNPWISISIRFSKELTDHARAMLRLWVASWGVVCGFEFGNCVLNITLPQWARTTSAAINIERASYRMFRDARQWTEGEVV